MKCLFDSRCRRRSSDKSAAEGWLFVGDFLTGEIRALSPIGEIQLVAKVPGGALFLASIPPLALPQGPLRFHHEADSLVLNWERPFLLQASTTPDGEFDDVVGAASPWTADTRAAVRFFRLRR